MGNPLKYVDPSGNWPEILSRAYNAIRNTQFVKYWGGFYSDFKAYYVQQVQILNYRNGIYMPVEDIELTLDLPVAYVTGEVIAGGVSNGIKSVKYFKEMGNSLNNLEALDDFINDPSKLNGLSPEELHNYLKDNGYNPQPLSKGSLGGIPFEEGGGFKVNWGGDRILQYHPAGGHHGGVEYWKLSSGVTGTNRYDMFGNLIK